MMQTQNMNTMPAAAAMPLPNQQPMITPGTTTQMAPVSAAPTGAHPAPLIASLYVGDLDRDVTEAMLYDIFNTVGPVASIRVCRESQTKQSLGYAYVNFHSASDAERVMDTLNYSKIKGRPCRIMWSHRDPNMRKSGSGNIFVKNLDKSIDNKSLYDTFSLFGNILSCKVATDSHGKSKGHGFVHYETDEAANQAIEKVNGMMIGEKQVFVGRFVPRDQRDTPEITNFTNLFLKNFPQEWTEELLKEKMAEFGEVTSLKMEEDKKGRKFAFVNFGISDEAHKAIEAYHKKDFRSDEEKENEEKKAADSVIDPDDHPEYLMYCQRAMTKTEREQMLKSKFEKSATPDVPQGVNLYIKNLPDDCNDEKLNALFAEFGEITSARVMVDENKRSKGFGFVCYKSPDEASKAVTEMHLKTIKQKPLYVGLAEKKELRSSRLVARFKGTDGKGKGFEMGKGMMNPVMGGKGMGPQFQMGPPNGMKGGPLNGMMGPQGGMMGGMGPMMNQPMMINNQMMLASQNRPPMMGQPRPPMMSPGGYPMMQGPGGMMGPNGMNPNPMMGGKGGNPMMAGNPMMKGMPGNPMNGAQMKGMPAPGVPGQMQGMNGGPMQVGGPMGARPNGGPMNPQNPNMAPGAAPPRLTAADLQAATPQQQKQMLGEKLFPLVHRFNAENAGKITGMMLEMENIDILNLLDNDQSLRSKVEEALRVLQQGR